MNKPTRASKGTRYQKALSADERDRAIRLIKTEPLHVVLEKTGLALGSIVKLYQVSSA